jgi:cysteine desulfurase
MDCVEWLARHQGAEAVWLPVDSLGRTDPQVVRRAIEQDPETVALISCMWANNEVGTVQPIDEIVEVAHAHGIPVHSDAVQVFGQLPVDFAARGLDAMAVSAHKIGGPLGVGALVVARECELVPVLHGGGQERDVRSGTVPMPLVAGFAAAAQQAAAEQPRRAKALATLRDELISQVHRAVPDAVLNGDDDPQGRLPGNAHFSFPGCEGDALMMLLDAHGVQCSTGSACTAGVARASHVLLAMGASEERARGSLRFSLGHTSTSEDIDALIEALGPAVDRARRAGLAGMRR